uniref:Uncharacterized protein n=1 Tax=viral metagenome TaxID=1070528 RepID=A0A6C0DB77_9ZZZZ
MATTQIVPHHFAAVHLPRGGTAWQALQSNKSPVVGGLYKHFIEPAVEPPVGIPQRGVVTYNTYFGAKQEYCMDPNDPAFDQGWEKQRNRRKEHKMRRKQRARRPSWMGAMFDAAVLGTSVVDPNRFDEEAAAAAVV